MRRLLLPLAMGLVFYAMPVVTGHAQQAAPQDIIDALAMKTRGLEQQLDALYLQYSQYHAQAERDLEYLRKEYVPKPNSDAKHD